MKQFNLTEYLQTKREVVTAVRRPARILCTDAKNEDFPIVALVEVDEGKESVYYYTKEGHFCGGIVQSVMDLYFAPKKEKRYINLYKNESTGAITTGLVVYINKEDALQRKVSKDYNSYFKTVCIEWEED